jgi:4-hydroxythreonine-4-phosphate dehydrogenase
MSESQKPIAITMGDVAGIGPEIIARLYMEHADEMHGTCVVGDVCHLQRALSLVGCTREVVPLNAWMQACALPPNAIALMRSPAVNIEQQGMIAYGAVHKAAGMLAASAIRFAAQAALRGDVSAVVTAPIHKEALALAGEPFPGHTELLQAEAAQYLGKAVADVPVRMMLANPELRVVLVSIHVGLRAALDAVTFNNVLETIRIAHVSLSRMAAFAGRKPRIAVAGLNPHAGEGGLFGREEIDVIAPAVQAACSEGMAVQGPFSPDTVFMRARGPEGRGKFDVVVAMYHDQGLIPVKYLGVEQGVNVTLGLPLVRTSPDHGTAFNIAGHGVADASSLLHALRMARQLAAQ